MGAGTLTKSPVGRLSWVAAGCAGALVLAGHLNTLPGADVAWNLYAGREVLGGARVGIDILENTAPMIFWLEALPLWVAGRLGVDPWHAWAVFVVALAAASSVLVRRLVPEDLPAGFRQAAGPLALTALLLGAVRDFGQREQVTIALVLPLMLVTARRLAGHPVAPNLAAVAGVLAGLGIGIKPFFVLAWLGLLMLDASHHRWTRQTVRRPEHIGVVVTGAGYLLLVAFLAPGYFRYAAEYGPLYRRYLPMLPWEMLAYADGLVTPLVAIGYWAAVRRGLPMTVRSVTDSLAVGAGLFLLAAVLQGKGWRYHFLPAITAGLLLIATLLVCRAATPGALRRLYRYAGVLVVVWAVLAGLWDGGRRILRPGSTDLTDDPNAHALLAVTATVPEGESLAVLSTNMASGWPLVLAARRPWAFRFPSLWPLVAFYYDQVRAGQLVHYREPDTAGALERRFTAAVEDDLLRARPALLFVVKPAPEVPGWGGARRFDYLGWVRHAPRLGARWLSGYRQGPDVGDYQVFRRVDLP